ncbi:hypothetical protein [Bradyrhizobium sp. CB2312]|uniref:hypothetical protein n=1 Tax=Bradyrhizobium sp. CB2312 TaxID=3039155 RepID=UPI0024B22B68|nr:hypothetical protein [Bradyrhizobium sp. CB2312]WFU71280.1 hypothetical protein QA642_39705 [Bradyrhizobium sp. CB2312]
MLEPSTSPRKERYAAPKDNIIKLIQPGNAADQLTEVLRNGHVPFPEAALAEVKDFHGMKTDGHRRIVGRGHLLEHEVITGIGPVAIRHPGVRDREADATDPDAFGSPRPIPPPYMCVRSRSRRCCRSFT